MEYELFSKLDIIWHKKLNGSDSGFSNNMLPKRDMVFLCNLMTYMIQKMLTNNCHKVYCQRILLLLAISMFWIWTFLSFIHLQQYNIKLAPQTFQFYKVLVTFRWILILPVYQAKFSLPYVSIMNSLDKVQFNLSWVNLLHHWHLIKLCSTWYCQAKSKQTITEFWRWKQAKISARCLASIKCVQMTSFSRSPKNITFFVLILPISPISPKLSRFLHKAPSIDQISDLVLCHGTSKKAKIFDFLTKCGHNVFLT